MSGEGGDDESSLLFEAPVVWCVRRRYLMMWVERHCVCASVRDSYASTTVRAGSITWETWDLSSSRPGTPHGPGRLRPTCVTGGDVGAVMSMVRALARLRSSLVLRALACLLSLTASTAHPHRSRSTRSPFSTTSQASPSSLSSSGVWSTRVSARARQTHNGESARAAAAARGEARDRSLTPRIFFARRLPRIC